MKLYTLFIAAIWNLSDFFDGNGQALPATLLPGVGVRKELIR